MRGSRRVLAIASAEPAENPDEWTLDMRASANGPVIMARRGMGRNSCGAIGVRRVITRVCVTGRR
jgi:hypothetical protein